MQPNNSQISLQSVHHGLPLRQEELKKLEETMTAFSEFTGVPVTFFDAKGEPVWERRSENKLCNLFDMYRDQASPCRKGLLSATKISNQLGEPYVFVCKAGFVNISMPLLIMGKPFGHFVAGPMVMGFMQESLLTNIFSLTKVREHDIPKLMVFVRSMKDYTPKEVSHLSVMFGSGVISSIRQNADYAKASDRNAEQKRIGERIRLRKQDADPSDKDLLMSRAHNLENQMVNLVEAGESDKAAAVAKELVEELTLAEAGDLAAVKIKILSICTVLARLVEEDSYIYEIDALGEASDIEELAQLTSSFVDKLSASFTGATYGGNSQLIRNALEYIHRNYNKKISLTGVSDILHINPSYLSMLFKQEVGLAFTDYVNNFRVVKSRDLLSRTNLSLGEIASLTGFEDQSYFSKTFKRFNGSTPMAFRKNHKAQNAAERQQKLFDRKADE
jgi:AraC-like DNA-binding protein/ligand-binding sensor protein